MHQFSKFSSPKDFMIAAPEHVEGLTLQKTFLWHVFWPSPYLKPCSFQLLLMEEIHGLR